MSHIRFYRMILFAAVAVSLILPASAAAREHFAVGIGYYGGGYYGGPFFPYGYGYGYPYYGYGPYGGYGYYSGRPIGEVHIKSPEGKAQIFINGAFAGRAHDLKTVYLAPGTYNIEQRFGTDVQKQHVYVLANRSLKLEFEKPGMASNVTPSPKPDANQQPMPQAPPRPVPYGAPQPAPAPDSDPGAQR